MRMLSRIVLSVILCGCLLSPFSSTVSAQAVAYYGTPVLDGNLDEWVKVSPLNIDQKEQLIQGHSNWSDPLDGSGIFYVMWDEENLYLAGSIVDDVPFTRFDPFGLSGNDGLIMYLSTNPQADLERILYDTTDFRVAFAMDNDLFDTGIDRSSVLFPKGIATRGMGGFESAIAGYKMVLKETEQGFDFEMRIPFAAFANDRIPVLKPEPEMKVGFNLVLIDLDQACPGSAASHMAWHPGNPEGTPHDWGTLRFTKAE